MYQPIRPARQETVRVRTLDYHVNLWGRPEASRPPLVLLHGWMDVGASWQFVVDAMACERFVIAPDWRGFGRTTGAPVDTYWFPDYLGDLDALLDHYAGDAPVDLVGHSMGGNVAMHYAGARPQRLRRLVNLEGFGMPAREPTEVPGRYSDWMDQLKSLRSGEMALSTYPDADGVASRLMKTNPRLDPAKAAWLARHWAAPMRQADGEERWCILGDAAHKVVNANIYRVDETLALYAGITAPVLMVVAEDDSFSTWWRRKFTFDEFRQRFAQVRDGRFAKVMEAGHMLHHDQPERVASIIEEFIDA